MSEFKPNLIDLSTINKGNKYNDGDGVHASSINSAIEASAWAQTLGTNQPNSENAKNYGTPSVYIEKLADGTPRFVFENLIGIGIVAVALTEEKGLDFTLSDGTHLYTPSVQGEKGDTGEVEIERWI